MPSQFLLLRAESPMGINPSSLQAAAANPVPVFLLLQGWSDSQGWEQGPALDQQSGQLLQPGLLQDCTAGFREICCAGSFRRCQIQQLDRGGPWMGAGCATSPGLQGSCWATTFLLPLLVHSQMRHPALQNCWASRNSCSSQWELWDKWSGKWSDMSLFLK